MSFIQYETSDILGAPVELYKIYSDGFSEVYHFTSADENISYNGDTYVAVENLKSTQIGISEESLTQPLTITLPRDNPLALKWLTFVPPRTVWIRISSYHRTEIGTPEVVIMWQGKIRGVKWSLNEAELSCQPIDSAFSRNGLRRTYATPCQHLLYDSRTCKVPLDSYKKNATITAINGTTLTSPGFITLPDDTTVAPLGWWVTGFLQTSDLQLRMITAHTNGGIDIEVLTGIETLSPGDTVLITAGCDRKYTTCLNKFNNVVNHGGLGTFMSADNPFTIKIA